MPFEGGPYVKAALFVNQVIEGKDDVLSLIRVIDRIVTTAQGSAPPNEMPPVTGFTMHAVLMFVSGKARGRHQVRLVREAPSGDRSDRWSGALLLEGEHKGQNLNLRPTETFELEGNYWYDVYVDEELMTRMPFQIVYQPMSSG